VTTGALVRDRGGGRGVRGCESQNADFLIAGGLYWETALRKTGGEVAVYAKRQKLKQADKHIPQAKQNHDKTRFARESLALTFGMVLTFCINSTRGRGGHKPPRWIRMLRRLGKEMGEPTPTTGPLGPIP